MGSLDVAGVVGTWVAACLALVALVGVIGPILIWRASRTSRHQALATIGKDNSNFISKGFHAGPGIWLFQRVRAPLLDREPCGLDQVIDLNFKAQGTSFSPISWISLGQLLTAYGIQYARGDNLKVVNGKAFLPVHRAWLLLIGLLGQYRPRRDHTMTLSRTRGLPQASSDITTVGLQLGDARNESLGHTELYGRSGKLEQSHLSGESAELLVELRTAFIANVDRDVPFYVSTRTLLALAAGLMPLGQDCFFSLFEEGLNESNAGSLSEWESSDDDQEQARDHDEYGMPRYYDTWREKRARVQEVQVYQFTLAHEHTSSLNNLGRPFDINAARVQIINKVAPSRTLSHDLHHYDKMTYIPSEVPWVRLPREKGCASCFVLRAHAHEMAHSLLNLQWNPQGYVLGGSRASIGMRLLTNAASRFIRIAQRMKHSIDKIGLSDDQKSTLKQALASAIRCTERRVFPDRSTAGVFCKLDQVLQGLCQSNETNHIVERMIGILMLLQTEFQDLFYQSLRHLNQRSQATIRVDTRKGQVVVPSAFGGQQTFALDLEKIFSDEERNQDAVNVPYSTVVVASLKACTRSQMLKDCFDAGPLMRFILDCPDVVPVG